MPLTVEADLSPGLPSFVIVGLPDAAVQESRERVRASIKNSGLPFPQGRLTVNLAPADCRKEGSGYDLPIAVAVLAASGAIPAPPRDTLVVGELSLDGAVRPVRGVLAIAQEAVRAGVGTLLVPAENAAEGALVPAITVIPVPTLIALLQHLDRSGPLTAASHEVPDLAPAAGYADLSVIRGQQAGKRALEIAAAGNHNILLSGPPGSGKTLLAHALPSLLPPLAYPEALEVTRIYSAAGALPRGESLIRSRPFRHPHHSASAVAMVGGGTHARPGEISLAHRGVLFMDEFPEFPRAVLEHLRQPLEDGVVTVSRASGSHLYPARFLLVAAKNPCPCGYGGDPQIVCNCTTARLDLYRRRLSGPLMDRIDLAVLVPRQDFAALTAGPHEEPSAAVRERVIAARARQAARNGPGTGSNGELRPGDLSHSCPLTTDATATLGAAVDRLRLSARAFHRVLKVARTIADLEGVAVIGESHVLESLQFRPRVG